MKKVSIIIITAIVLSSAFFAACSSQEGSNSKEIETTDNTKIETTSETTSETFPEQSTVQPTTQIIVTEIPTTIAPKTESTTKEYTGIELANMNLKDIITIMGGEYDTVSGMVSPAFSSEPIPYIYNDSALPGFYFTEFKEGDFDTNEFAIAIKDGAKLNDTISSNMTYNELTAVIGDFDVQAVGGEWSLSHYADIEGHSVAFIIEPNDYLYQNMTGGKASSKMLKEANPHLKSIGLRAGM